MKESESPKVWTDLLNPIWKGQILLVNPKATDSAIEFWSMILDKYGEEFFTRLRAQNLRLSAGVVPAMQQLAAGEASFGVPTVDASVQALRVKGAPIATVMPSYTTGTEIQVFLTARRHVKHPNAARLLANYMLTPEGNKVLVRDQN